MLLLSLACRGEPEAPPLDTRGLFGPGDSVSTSRELDVWVTLDGVPVEGATISQGGNTQRWTSFADAPVRVTLDLTVPGELVVMASLPDARIRGDFPPDEGPMTIALERFSTSDNPAYEWQDPGTPSRRDTTNQCAHCHAELNEQWYASPHATSATNPHFLAVFAGVEAATGAHADCSDCHAPGLGPGTDVASAEGVARDYGVSCDICHKVESVDLEQPPGAGGALRLLRPSEPQEGALGPWKPLTFGPYDDVMNPRMGAVKRDVFHQAMLCGGCHQGESAVLVSGASIDLERWPSGKLPVHTTYGEWLAGPMSPGAVCQSCHMPPDGDAANAGDLGHNDAAFPGPASGWYRAPGEVLQHSFIGPRQRESGMLELAANLEIEQSEVDGELVVEVKTRNVGAGHAIPTGEPLRNLILRVRARCGEAELAPTGGDVVPDYGGAKATRAAGEDWSAWPEAAVGDLIRVIRRSADQWVSYTGYGLFAGSFFTDAQKGIPVEQLAGEARVVSVDPLVLDRALPEGDLALLGSGAWPEDGAAALPLAGAPGWGFARVMVGADGARMVPHYLATDVVSDNRLMPQAEWTSTHRFEGGCAEPVVDAVLLHRAAPWSMTEAWGGLADSVMVSR